MVGLPANDASLQRILKHADLTEAVATLQSDWIVQQLTTTLTRKFIH